MLASDPVAYSVAVGIKELEHQCDDVTHEVIRRLHRTFVTPIDREDIHAMAGALDNVMDAIDESSRLFPQYRIEQVRDGTRQLSRIIVTATDQLLFALRSMERHESITPSVVEINRLEDEADVVHQEAVGRLFIDERDPTTIVKWEQIYNHLEAAVDGIEDVADVIQGVTLKEA
jgi:hypothetical protein